MMGGLFGRVFREFAVSLAVAVAVSLVVSLTTTPMMCARLLRPQADERRGLFYRISEGLFLWFLRRYETTLAWVLRHQPLMLLVTLATIGSSIYLYVVVPKGFFPQQDTGTIFGSITEDRRRRPGSGQRYGLHWRVCRGHQCRSHVRHAQTSRRASNLC
jgi:multidrug efflux pump